MRKIDREKIDAFLVDLTQLTKKYGIVIHGCGCCDSPSLHAIEDDQQDCSYQYQDEGGAGTPEIAFK